jgi:uncharacterized protein YqeY
MSIQHTIEQAYLSAFKAHDQAKVDTLRLIKAALKNAEIDLRKHELTDAETLSVLTREAKRRRESIVLYQQGNRPELAAIEQSELTVIEAFLPAQLSDDELQAITASVITELKPTPKDFGKVMSAVMAKVKGQADGNRVTAVVKTLLK